MHSVTKNPEISVGNRKVGIDHEPLVIAEIGINHNGEISKAIQMVKEAHQAGAECVKFQCHIIEDEMSHHAKDTIPGNADQSIYEIMKKCALTFEETKLLKDLVESLGMIYLSTPFSRAAANRLEDLGVCAYKIGSGECNNYPLLEHLANFGKPIILSTGMNDVDSIYPAVEIFREKGIPFALLHCTSMYPTPYSLVRLGSLEILRNSFPDAVLGLSDHSIGNYTCFGSVPLGASILEKHYTADKTWDGPDVSISIDPLELKDLIKGTKIIHQSLGGEKAILKEETPTINFAYASVVAIEDIKEGESFTMDNIWVKRPGTGELLAKDFSTVLGKTSLQDIKNGTQIKKQFIEVR